MSLSNTVLPIAPVCVSSSSTKENGTLSFPFMETKEVKSGSGSPTAAKKAFPIAPTAAIDCIVNFVGWLGKFNDGNSASQRSIEKIIADLISKKPETGMMEEQRTKLYHLYDALMKSTFLVQPVTAEDEKILRKEGLVEFKDSFNIILKKKDIENYINTYIPEDYKLVLNQFLDNLYAYCQPGFATIEQLNSRKNQDIEQKKPQPFDISNALSNLGKLFDQTLEDLQAKILKSGMKTPMKIELTGSSLNNLRDKRRHFQMMINEEFKKTSNRRAERTWNENAR